MTAFQLNCNDSRVMLALFQSVVPTDSYLSSLNIPYYECDRENKEQLKMHLLCSMLCCPKQIEEDGTFSAELVNMNMREVSNHCLDLCTVGRFATDADKTEADRIEKNLERVFQLPLFERIVELDTKTAKFRPIPPPCLQPLYERILQGGHWLRMREGQAENRKEKECNTPQAVYRSKVVCNFLMELIEREERSQKRRFVDWQSVQNRYQKIFSDDGSEDGELVELYKTKYLMEFPYTSLNSDLVKSWTGRSTITKALSMPTFAKIDWKNEQSTGLLRVGIRDNIVLYSDEELKRAYEAMSAPPEQKERRFGREEKRKREPENDVDELTDVVPLRQRQGQSTLTSILPQAAASPFASIANPKPTLKPTTNWTNTIAPFASIANPEPTLNPPSNRTDTMAPTKMVPESSKRQPPPLNPKEPQYIPTSGKFDESSDSFSDSDESLDGTGVYSDDEEMDDYKETSDSPDKDRKLASSPPHPEPQRPTSTKPKPEPSSAIPRPASNLANAYRATQEPVRIEENVETFRNPWEDCDDDNDKSAQIKPIPQPQRSSTPIQPEATSTATINDVLLDFAQPGKVEASLRHASAFASCKSTASVAKKDSSAATTPDGRSSVARESGRESARTGLYERRTNESKEKRHEFGESSTSRGPNRDARYVFHCCWK
ncbi:hypothetical protein Y032_0086g1908 [Ancylostoma ceylanicum]|uniref:Uncharacterized protein n=2 Tax=Ancylostoma ceylanicum TaxID=53326 RepID=A0A016TQD9_9BILA|nr:hypothetical protein Y032_0086g1908 [Ancylostoma ceylanicum]